ncbi:MAG: glutamate synthase subunit alpha, partial [Thermoleophilia bacterium]|nr:glutamate synthase subunit alpha [Thermoleophilia bacterium]
VGARVSGDIAERLDPTGLDGLRAHVRLDGSAGQSFAAFAIRGLRLELVGEANDAVGKGLAGAHVDLRFRDGSPMADDPAANAIAGNACLYGATAGLLLVGGMAGERFAVRNSGADAVAEAAGDHLCEYMTGGTVVVLGPVGRNVASGMTGGTLWVLDDGSLDARLADTATVIEPSEEQLEHLRRLLALHAGRTGSVRAAQLLESGDELDGATLRCITAAEQAAAVRAAAPPVPA